MKYQFVYLNVVTACIRVYIYSHIAIYIGGQSIWLQGGQTVVMSCIQSVCRLGFLLEQMLDSRLSSKCPKIHGSHLNFDVYGCVWSKENDGKLLNLPAARTHPTDTHLTTCMFTGRKNTPTRAKFYFHRRLSKLEGKGTPLPSLRE